MMLIIKPSPLIIVFTVALCLDHSREIVDVIIFGSCGEIYSIIGGFCINEFGEAQPYKVKSVTVNKNVRKADDILDSRLL